MIDQKVSIDKREEVVGGKSSTPAPFDLKTELEKLDNLKKSGLISESEFKELRQRAMDTLDASSWRLPFGLGVRVPNCSPVDPLLFLESVTHDVPFMESIEFGFHDGVEPHPVLSWDAVLGGLFH